jgi:hypothetical protein
MWRDEHVLKGAKSVFFGAVALPDVVGEQGGEP